MSDTRQITRTSGGRFAPGHSACPGGRRKTTEQDRQIDRLARASSVEALAVVKELMKPQQPGRVRLAAALAIVERAHGKPGDRLSEPLTLPEGATLAQQGEAVMLAACEGRIAAAQASALLAGLGAVARLVETTELQARIEALEARK